MKTLICLLGLALAPLPMLALMPRSLPAPLAAPAPAGEVSLMGTLQQRVALGGETTGWSLHYDQDQRVDLLLPIDAFAWIRDGLAVGVKGHFETRQYPERGAVRVLVVREITQVVT
ncbi:hypothetical protein [Opitutus sp. GAS368]|jgi:hypothetical protein|uniref:hypothetical protein n=1 Tax=Opitutus sp. GAS368 TaxID=1882749 RepID=UPI00087B732C|nr:hypothetical protein [Opitutus sp. GAS368]SDS02925.1 hypothetical protein SAMN05444173_1673 [Opitutus sp. GAS368]